ncbi:MAG TPA: hypothetical protein VEC12_12005 [Bacteroidia bacterium]|nr:hypothetical protein [Bacteroidia bacterium]
MKTKIITTILLFFFAVEGYSQIGGTHRRTTLSLNIGLSTPLADFASTDYANPASGYARMGTVGDLTYTYLIGKYFGVAAKFRFLVNPYSYKSIDEQLTTRYQSQGIDWQVTAYRYGMGTLLAGGYGCFPITGNVSIDAKLMGGYMLIRHPDVDARGWDDAQDYYFVGKKMKDATGFAASLEVGVKWKVSRHLAILANTDYYMARPRYEEFQTSTTGNIELHNFTQNFATLSYTIGLGVMF